MHTSVSLSLSLSGCASVRVCVYLISVHMHRHINSHTRVRARGGEEGSGAPHQICSICLVTNLISVDAYEMQFSHYGKYCVSPLYTPLLCLFMLGFLPFALPVFEIVIGQCISLFRLPANELLTLSKDSS